MELRQRIERQRVLHIVDSFALWGDTSSWFQDSLEQLFSIYKPATIELAIVDTLILHWMQLPPLKGIAFMKVLQERLQSNLPTIVTPTQYRCITGLDPAPLFASLLQPCLQRSEEGEDREGIA